MTDAELLHNCHSVLPGHRAHPLIRPNPACPQANMLHLHLPVARERALAIRNQIAAQHRIWLFGRAAHGVLPQSSIVELYVGDNLLDLPDHALHDALALLSAALAEPSQCATIAL